jgi:branched-chain amino acid transport system substrate-binding protein
LRNKLFLMMGICILIIVLVLPSCAGGQSNDKETNVITLGVPAPMGFINGKYVEQGLKLAIDEINAAGGVDVAGTMYKFKDIIIDTRDLEESLPVSDALLAMEKLILEKNVDFIVGGPARSEAAMASMDMVNDYKKISIVSVGALTRVYTQRIAEDHARYQYCFRVTGSALDIVAESVSIMETIRADKKFNKVYIMSQDVSHARDGTDRLVEELKKIGAKKVTVDSGTSKRSEDEEAGTVQEKYEGGVWNILATEFYPTGTSDFSTGLLKAKNMGAQLLYIWMDMPEASILFNQWADLKIPALPLGYMFAASDADYWKVTNGKCEYLVNCDPKAGSVPIANIPMSVKFVEAWKKAYGTAPGGLGCSTSYMVPYLLKNAIERAGSLKGTAVITALEQTKMEATFGILRFDPKSHQIVYSQDPKDGAVACWSQWQAGERVAVYPPSVASGVIKYPPWMK